MDLAPLRSSPLTRLPLSTSPSYQTISLQSLGHPTLADLANKTLVSIARVKVKSEEEKQF